MVPKLKPTGMAKKEKKEDRNTNYNYYKIGLREEAIHYLVRTVVSDVI